MPIQSCFLHFQTKTAHCQQYFGGYIVLASSSPKRNAHVVPQSTARIDCICSKCYTGFKGITAFLLGFKGHSCVCMVVCICMYMYVYACILYVSRMYLRAYLNLHVSIYSYIHDVHVCIGIAGR
jgi:hypothetical protein